MDQFLLIAGMALVTFLIRYIMIPVSGKIEFPPLFDRALRYVPPSVLTAIIVPSVLMPEGVINFSHENAYLVGGIAACLVGWFSKNLMMTIVLSMVVFMAWQWCIGAF